MVRNWMAIDGSRRGFKCSQLFFSRSDSDVVLKHSLFGNCHTYVPDRYDL